MANMALESRRTRPYAPLIGGILIGVAHAARGGAIEHENYSPPLEGCRGGLFRDGKDPPRRLMPSAPPWRGFSEEPVILRATAPPRNENNSPFEGKV